MEFDEGWLSPLLITNLRLQHSKLLQGRDGKQKLMLYKPLKSKVEGIQDAVFESRAVKYAAQFTKILEEIQKKYNSDIMTMIKDM